MSQQIQTILLSIIKTKKSQFNDRTMVNIAFAYVFLLSHQPDVKPMVELFNSFDSTLDLNLCLGFKYAILMTGHAQVPRSEFAA